MSLPARIRVRSYHLGRALAFMAPGDWMLDEKENRLIEAGLLLAVPIWVAITSLAAVFCFAGI